MQISSPNGAFSTVCIHFTAQFNLSDKQRAVSWKFSLDSLFSRPTKGKHWRRQFEIEDHTKPLGWIYSKCFSTIFGGNDLTLCHELKLSLSFFALPFVPWSIRKALKQAEIANDRKYYFAVARRSSSCSLPSWTVYAAPELHYWQAERINLFSKGFKKGLCLPILGVKVVVHLNQPWFN